MGRLRQLKRVEFGKEARAARALIIDILGGGGGGGRGILQATAFFPGRHSSDNHLCSKS